MQLAPASGGEAERAAASNRQHQYNDGEEYLRGQTATDESEAQVLREFYRATVGRTWVRLSDFDGVTLDGRGRTRQIQLSGRRLKIYTCRIDWGTLAGLLCLTVLDLSSNALRGKIPEALGDLVSLERLDLHQNRFYGTIPADLGKLPRLRCLRLSNNNLSGQIPEEVAGMSTLELLDCSKNKLSGLLPAWACMGTVYGKAGDPHPNQMYMFVMDTPPKSLRAGSVSTRDEEARARAVGWIQWHLDQDEVPAAMEEQPLPQPQRQSRRRQMCDTQVLLVDLPQYDTASVRFKVKANSDIFSFIFALASVSKIVFGAVNHAAATATSMDDFPHRVVEINSTNADTLGTSSLPTSGQDSDERQGRGGATSVGAGGRSTAARVTGVDLREHHPLDTRQESYVETDGDYVAYSSLAPALLPSPCSCFSLKRDENFVDAWEACVQRDERCSNSVCSFVRDYAFLPVLRLFQLAVLFSPYWAQLFYYPLFDLLGVLGVMTLALLLPALLLECLKSRRTARRPRPGDVGPSAHGLRCCFFFLLTGVCVVVYAFVQLFALFAIMIGSFALTYVSGLVLVKMFTSCGVLKEGHVPALEITVEPQTPSRV